MNRPTPLLTQAVTGAALALALALALGASAAADTVTAKLRFDNMLPFTGVLYAPDKAAPRQRATLDQKDKAFSTPVVVVSPEAELKIKNSDDFEHNVFADDKRQTGIAFDLGRIPAHDQLKLPVRWKEDSLLRLGCKIHPKMKTYVANLRSQHVATIPFAPGRQDYEVSLVQVPAGLQEIRVLLPDLPPLSATLKAGESRTLTVTAKGRTLGTIELARRGDN
ncbi:MAG: hypothetical protein K0S16_37 [Moraxellaceae bacterium]|nr:hypothetical protein [Moraxellaceae bacterium]